MSLFSFAFGLFTLPSRAVAWTSDPATQAWAAVIVITFWLLSRFNRTVRSWLVKFIRVFFSVLLEVIIVIWGLCTIWMATSNYLYGLLPRWGSVNKSILWELLPILNLGLSALMGGVIALMGVRLSLYFICNIYNIF